MPRFIKAIVTAALIALLAAIVNWHELQLNLRRVEWQATVIVVGIYGVQFFTSGWKWQSALAVLGARLPAGFLIRIYCIAHFLGQFLPSAIGGDAYRVYRTMPLVQPRSRALSAIVIDRLVGFAALLSLGALGALALQRVRLIADAYLAALVLAGGGALLAVLIANRGGFRRVTARLRAFAWFQAVLADYGQLQQARGKWLPLIGWSLAFQAISVSVLYILFQGVATPVPWAECALIAAAAGAASILPISINGLGVVEGSLAGTAVALGVNYEHALVVAVLARLLVAPLSLICGLIYLAEPKQP
jgi:glycosyltransferase 2 family protein